MLPGPKGGSAAKVRVAAIVGSRDGDASNCRPAGGTCGGTCHGTYINPIGFAFESFDGLGQHRETENGLPIDSSAAFEFQDGMVEFDGAAELSSAMAERIETHDCYTKHWVEYALGRDTAGSDLDLIQRLGDDSSAGVSIRALILDLVRSEEFRSRNAEGT